MTMPGEIGRVVFRRKGGTIEVVLDAAGDWIAPPRLRDFLSLTCPTGRHAPADGPWGWDQLERAADLLGGTAVPRRYPVADPNTRDCQAPPPAGGSADFAVIQIPHGAVRVDAPDLTQDHDEEQECCGPVLLEAFARYFDVHPDDHTTDVRDWFYKKLGTTWEGGTPPDRMAALAEKLGLNPEVHHPMADDQLKAFIDAGKPVVVCLQAWGDQHHYDKDESGHYVGAIGYDSENVYFEDPWLKRARGYMGWPQFRDRWHDKSEAGDLYRRWGMALWRPQDPARRIE